MAYRLTHEPPDNAMHDAAAIAIAMILLAVCCVLASIVPAVPAT